MFMAQSKDTPRDVVEKLLELTKGDLLPWNCPWMRRQPKNPLSGTTYRGINWLLLTWKMGEFDGDNRFATYKQVQEFSKKQAKPMFIKAGSKGSMIVKYGMFQKDKEMADGSHKDVSIPYMQTWSVFSVTQIDGWDIPNTETYGTKAFPEVNALIQKMGITVKGGNKAAYSPSGDYLIMPPSDTFKSPELHLAVALHELLHASGHKDRLNRKSMEDGYDKEYAIEEMVAEIGVAIAMAELGIEYQIQQSADYIKGWWSVIQSNPKSFIWAVSQAQKAVEYVLGTTIETVELTETETESFAYVG